MENLLPWFRLKSVPGIGNHLFKRLMDHFESPENIFQASHEQLLAVDGMSPRLVAAIFRHQTPETVKKDIDLLNQKGYQIITLKHKEYPPLLRQIPDPPPFLYVYGSMNNAINNIAVVGSRNATGYGISTTKRLCRDLAAVNLNVVSGMAIGIDTAAHEGAMDGGGRTIAVLGSGLETVYPRENLKLFHRIAENGAVISELPLSAEPDAHNFPQRNRIISGISLGTVVVEASKRSGALITARLAAEQNREVFAVPGNIHSFKSTGTHTLIKQGAKLVEHAMDIIEELQLTALKSKGNETRPENVPLTAEASAVLEALGPYPVHIDDLVRQLMMEPGKLASILLQLELKGIVEQTPGKRFSVAVR